VYVQCTYQAKDIEVTTKEKRLNFRTTETVEAKLFAAAQASNESLTDFVLSAASRRADDILATRTPVPSDYFDHLLSALDEPPVAIHSLAVVAKRELRFTQR
ncbi:MAG TPA: DUF1778 domain-containing protein, partial [Acidimicrobiales bacterium]|nr:DUF1778 domain-containing protein [Acidimicrobiales bacterium]